MGSDTTLARPYARAAFEVAHERQALGPWETALHLAAAIAADGRARTLLGHPAVERAAVHGLLTPPEGAPEGFEAFLDLLIDNDRVVLLPEVAALFTVLKDAAEQTLAVQVRSAAEPEEGYLERLSEALAKRFGKKIELAVEIDPTMLGGAVVKAGDLVIDGSVRGKLTRLATAMRAA